MTDELAFPCVTDAGLTKREVYAIAAVPALITALAGKGAEFDDLFAAIADAAFAFADAMIEAGKEK